MVLRAILSAALLLPAFLPAAAAAADLDGLPIRSIVLKDASGAPWPEPEDVESLLLTRPGHAFSAEAVRRSIAYLYLKQQFRDIRAEAFSSDGGLRLEYTFLPLTRIENVVLRGNHSLRGQALRDVIGNLAGRELREEDFADIRAGIQARYQAEGFFNVRVDFLARPAPRPNRVHLYIYIKEPKRTVIEELRFDGNRVFTDEQLRAVMQNRVGTVLRTDILLEDDLNAIQQLYVRAGHPEARPGPVRMRFRDEKAFLEIAGQEGPHVTVSFRGTGHFCADQFPDIFDRAAEGGGRFGVRQQQCDEYFRNLLLIWSERDASEAVIESSIDKVRSVYREKGYADAAVDVRRTEEDGRLDLVFTVREGPRVLVEDVLITGNRAFTARELRRLMATRPTGRLRTRLFRQEVLDQDVDALAEHYAAAGYLAASVRPVVTRTEDGGRAVIRLNINEGGRTLTGDITIAGNAVLADRVLRDAVRLRSGEPFSERTVEEDRYRILSLYAAKGHLYARVEVERTTPAQPPAGGGAYVDIRFRIEEDRPVAIGTVILRGNVDTRDAVILRELEPRTGEPYQYEAILKSQQRIYRYGYFNLAKFEPVRPHEREYVKDMLFTVEERAAGAVELGVGYGDLDRLRGFVEVSHRNLWGSAHFASLRFEGSDILYRTAFTYRQPWFLGFRNLDSRLLLAWSDAERINQDTREVYYETEKTTASYGIERTWNGLKSSLTYQFENVENYNVRPAAVLSPEDSGRVLISSLSPAVAWDLRDDPFNPRRGSVHGLTVKEALGSLGSEAEFTKATVQTTWFVPAAASAVLALSGRAGMAWPHRETGEVPIHERFYLGGSTTIRGFTQDSIGPVRADASGSLVPTGGASMLQLNAEVRFMAPGGSGVVVFADAGNVWPDQRLRTDDLRASYGAGLRYHTPVGPLRIDYGQKINRRTGESPGELHFNIGHAF